MSGDGDGNDGDLSASAVTSSPGRFFRASVVLPSVRDVTAERECRMARRREVNELAMRMGVGGIGGVIEGDKNNGPVDSATEMHAEEDECVSPIVLAHNSEDAFMNGPSSSQLPGKHEMWMDWSTCVEPWLSIRQIADRAVGNVVASQPSSSAAFGLRGPEPTVVPWSAIHRAWVAQRSSHHLRKTWSKGARVRISRETQQEGAPDQEGEEAEWDEGEEGRARYVNEVVEALRQDKDLDPHEERLLGCIIDPSGCIFGLIQHEWLTDWT